MKDDTPPLGDIFVNEFKELPDKLKEIGVNTLKDLRYKTVPNPKYFHETFDYKILDNEKIMNIIDKAHDKDFSKPSNKIFLFILGFVIWAIILLAFLLSDM